MIVSDFIKRKNISLAAKASLWFLICSLVQKCISLISTPIFTRVLTVDEYALFSIYNNWYQIFFVLISLKLESGVFNKGMSKYSGERDKYVTSMQGFVTVSSLVYIIIIFALQSFFIKLTGLPLLLLIMMGFHILFTNSITFWSLRQRYEFKFKYVVIITLILSIANMLLGLLFVLLYSGNKGLARIESVIIVNLVIGGIIYFKNIINSKSLIDWKHIQFALKFNLPLIPHYLSMYVLNSSDRLMIQKLCSDNDVAKYSVIYNIALVLMFLVDSLNSSLAPWLYQRLEEKKTDAIDHTIQIIGYGLAAMLIAYILLGPEVVSIMAGSKYSDAVIVLPPITGSVLCIFLYQLIGNIEFYYDSNRFTAFVSLTGAILNIVLNLIFIPMAGYVAAGFTTLICYIVFVIMHAIYAAVLSKNNENKIIISPVNIIILALVLLVICLFSSKIYPYVLLRFILVVILGIASCYILMTNVFMKKNKG